MITIVGAGLSGLVCATRLVAAGREVVVLEASDRVGGRLHTGLVGEVAVDLGGTWLSVGQPRLLALAAELGLATIPQRRDGRPVIELPWWGAFARWRAARKLRRLMRSPERVEDRSLAEWLAANVANASARSLLGMHAELVFAVAPDALSLRYYLATMARTGDFAPRGPDLPGGGREQRFADGAQAIAVRLAEALGDRVRLGTRVTEIVDGDDAIRIDGAAASHAILALPPWAARALHVDLGAGRAYAAAAVPGVVTKCFADYDRPFWRERRLSGEAYFPHGAIRAVVPLETTLVAFVIGPPPPRDAVIATLVDAFGLDAAAPRAYREASWAGAVASLPPGAGELGWGASHGRLHVAGAEAASVWPGYMEGAIEAGERAAAEVLLI